MIKADYVQKKKSQTVNTLYRWCSGDLKSLKTLFCGVFQDAEFPKVDKVV